MKPKIFLLLLSLFFTFSSGEAIKGWCGTLEAIRLFNQGKALQRPNLSGPVEYIERANLRVHFTQSGEDACDLSYAVRVANYTEYSWYKQVDTLLWASPPPDYGMGGDDRYDIYICVQPSGVARMTVAEANYSNPYPNGSTSYIAVDNRLTNEFLKIVCAHEFSHACQMRYSVQEMDFIFENTSVWMEDVCYEDINAYVSYLATTPNPLLNPDYPITSTENLYLYAGGIWFMFLDEYYDRNCPRRVWERLGEVPGRNTLTGIDDVLRNHYSSNLRQALKNYGLWRYFVCTYADTLHYFREGNRWPTPRILRTHTDYPCSGNQGSYPLSNRGGTSFVQFQNGAGKFSVAFDGQNGPSWRAWVIGFQTNNPQVFELNLDSALATGADSFDWGDNGHFVLIPVIGNWEAPASGITFNYNADCRIITDVGIQSIIGVPASADSGTVIIPKAWIKNYGISPATFSAFFRLGFCYYNTQTVTIAPSDSILQEFAPCTLLTRGNNDYICTLALDGDERRGNDSRTGRTIVWVKDVGVLSILEPVGTIGSGELVRPRARVKNFGNYSAQCNVTFSIENWSTTKRISLGAGSELDVLFDSIWVAYDTGEFSTKCSTAYSQDMNQSNDKVEDHFFVGPSGIEENIYSIPMITGTRFIIYNSLGVKIAEPTGKLTGLAPGVYFLKIQGDQPGIKRKILIIR